MSSGRRSALQARDLQQIGDETIEPVSLLLDDERALVAEWLQLVSERFDRRQWRAQIVRERGEQSVLQFVGFPKRFRALDRGPLRSCAVKELRSHDTGNEEDEKHEPIERVSHEQCVVRRQEKPIEGKKCGEGGGHPDNPAPCSARAENYQQKHERHMGFAQVTPSGEQRDCGRAEGQQCESPYRSARCHLSTAVTEARQSDIRPPAP